MVQLVVFSIGHSTHPYARFLELLRNAGVTAIADVRSAPFSRRFPHFNGSTLESALRHDGIAYFYLGKELGGRPSGAEYYRNGVVDYERLARSAMFSSGLDRVAAHIRARRCCAACAEHDPLSCHRCLLVGRALAARGVLVRHILADGAITDQREIEERLLQSAGGAEGDLFLTPDELLARAYRKRARGRGSAGNQL